MEASTRGPLPSDEEGRKRTAMSRRPVASPHTLTGSDGISMLLKQYGCGPVEFSGADDALYERHLIFDNVVDPAAAGPRDRYDALDALAKELQRDGAKAFVDSWYELMDVIASKSAVLDRAR
jgi:hypothetical protein